MAGIKGKAGPRPLPKALKVLRGTYRGDQNAEHEAMPETRLPSCPAHIQGEARREWKRTGKLLKDLGLIADVDRSAFAAYCQAWARWVDAEGKMREYGVVIVDKGKGEMKLSPFWGVANMAMDQMRHFLVEFGMTPASRTRVNAMPMKERNNAPDPKANFFNPN